MKKLFRKKTVAQILTEIKNNELEAESHSLQKTLGLRDLVSFGIAAIVGAGIFSTIGNASFSGGPAVVFLFIFTAFACLFSALCYAEFASTIPISGSAYTYAYTSFGELIAWTLGWSLVMEYAIGNIAVAISWSDYLTSLLQGFGLHIPDYLTMDYLSASRGFQNVEEALAEGKILTDLPKNMKEAYNAWITAPSVFNFKLIADIPALFITIAVTYLVFIGIKESKNAGNIMVIVKLSVVLMVIIVGAFYIKPENWSPFAPNGIAGILKGVSAVFFAYIGFDAISTTAEECKNPQKDLPRAMIYALVICTILYVIIALVLTGMVSYKELQVGDPLAFVFERVDLDFVAGIVSISAVVAITSVFLVFQLGQPRILMTMSRDGLLPKAFSKIHPKYKTPYVSTIFTGFLVAIPALFMNLTEVTDLTSIGTLFAFALVSGGVLSLKTTAEHNKTRFRVPYYSGKWIVPILIILVFSSVYYYNTNPFMDFISFSNTHRIAEIETEVVAMEEKVSLMQINKSNDPTSLALLKKEKGLLEDHKDLLKDEKGKTSMDLIFHRIPMWIFIVFCVFICAFTFLRNLSIIPVMGLLTNFYLITELGISNWIGFGIWMLIGLAIYFSYGYWHSKLGKAN